MDGRFVNDATAERLGRNVFMARRRAGFSQEALAALASLHRTEIGMIENGDRLPRVDTLIKIASALAVKYEELVAGIEWIIPAPSRSGSFAVQGGGADAR